MEHDPAKSTPGEEPAEGEELSFGEEEAGSDVPGRDLLAAGVIAILAVAASVLALLLPNPGNPATAPGLLPFITGLTLFLMALALGVSAWRAGGAGQLARFWRGAGWGGWLRDATGRRTALLFGIIGLYVLLVDLITFDLRYPTRLFELRFSSYEFVSIPMLTWILRMFWRAPLIHCLLVSLSVVLSLAWVFRSGFKILLPGSD
ncbi:MAG: hypothetical protein V3S29_14200 [bacterium]